MGSQCRGSWRVQPLRSVTLVLAAGRAPASSPSPNRAADSGARASGPWASPAGHAAQVHPPRLSLPPAAPCLAWVCPAFNQLGKPAPVACPSAPGVLEARRGGQLQATFQSPAAEPRGTQTGTKHKCSQGSCHRTVAGSRQSPSSSSLGGTEPAAGWARGPVPGCMFKATRRGRGSHSSQSHQLQ